MASPISPQFQPPPVTPTLSELPPSFQFQSDIFSSPAQPQSQTIDGILQIILSALGESAKQMYKARADDPKISKDYFATNALSAITLSSIQSVANQNFQDDTAAYNQAVTVTNSQKTEITNYNSAANSYSGNLSTSNSAIDQARNQLSADIDAINNAQNQTDRDAAVSQYNADVTTYNNLLTQYQTGANNFNSNVANYNGTVTSYNTSASQINEIINQSFHPPFPDLPLLTQKNAVTFSLHIAQSMSDSSANPPALVAASTLVQPSSVQAETTVITTPTNPPQLSDYQVAIASFINQSTQLYSRTRQIIDRNLDKLVAKMLRLLVATIAMPDSYNKTDSELNVESSGGGASFALATLTSTSLDQSGMLARALLRLAIKQANQFDFENVLLFLAISGARAGVLATVNSAEVLGVNTLQSQPPNQTASDLATSVAYLDSIGKLLLSDGIEQGLKQLGVNPSDFALSARFILQGISATKLTQAIRQPEFLSKTFDTATTVADSSNFPTLFNNLTSKNFDAIISSGPLGSGFSQSINDLLAKKGIPSSAIEVISRGLSTEQFNNASQLREFLSDKLKGTGVSERDVFGDVAALYGLSALQAPLAVTAPQIAGKLGNEIGSLSQLTAALQGLSPEALKTLGNLYGGHVLGLTFSPAINSALEEGLVSPQISKTLKDGILQSAFGFVPGQVPHDNSLFKGLVKSLDVLIQKEEQQKVDDRSDYVKSVHALYSTDLNKFNIHLMDPGGLMTLWTGHFYKKYGNEQQTIAGPV